MSLFRILLRLLTGRSKLAPQRRREPVFRSFEPESTFQKSAPAPRPELASFPVGHEILGRCFVVDGDTITIGGTTIRLAGIDAPEMEDPWGKKAKWELMQMCQGKKIRVVFDGTATYERGVATCYLPDGRDLGAEMVKLGLALDWAKFSGGKYREFEPPEIRKTLWRVAAKHQGRRPGAAQSGVKIPY